LSVVIHGAFLSKAGLDQLTLKVFQQPSEMTAETMKREPAIWNSGSLSVRAYNLWLFILFWGLDILQFDRESPMANDNFIVGIGYSLLLKPDA
jgi:hypothetical protein